MSLEKQKIITIRTLLAKAGLAEKEDKEALVMQFTNSRTSSISSMESKEALVMILHLKTSLGQVKYKPASDRCQPMKNKIISMAHEMGWRIPGSTKIDMEKLNNWCEKRGMYHKKLDKHTYEELPALVTQFEAVYRSFLRGLR